MNVDIEELKRLAEAATRGPWVAWPIGDYPPLFSIATEDGVGLLTTTTEAENDAVFSAVFDDNDADYIAAANPAAILELIAEMERLRDDADDLTIALESSEKLLKDSRANDYTAMGYLADCRIAVGDNGNRMLPEFVEYLRQLKQQRDELLAALREIAEWTERYTTPGHPISTVARAAIARAEG